jgi:hypothetical protein
MDDDLKDFLTGKGYQSIPLEFRHYGCGGIIRERKCDKCRKTGKPLLVKEALKPKWVDDEIDWGEVVARFDDEPFK